MKAIIEKLLIAAKEFGASDLHFLPKEKNVMVQVRADMKLHTIQTIEHETYSRLTLHMRYWCSLTEMNQRTPQSGIYEMGDYAIRVTFLPSFQYVLMSWRLPHRAFQLDRLLAADDVKRFHDVVAIRHGLFLIGGATGAGKTTILYALLESLKQERIVTIENPPEQELEGVIQLEVNKKSGLDHGSLLKETLRADPDIIVIGEVRTEDELRVAYDAALSGHLTITTFHTASVADGERRLEQLVGNSTVNRHWCVLTRDKGVTCEWAVVPTINHYRLCDDF